MYKFKNIKFPRTYKYSSDSENIPLEFYDQAFPVSKTIDLLLGYFSSNAIKILSQSIAEFIFYGGVMRLVTNHVYSEADYKNLIVNTSISNEDKVLDIFGDLAELESNLSQEGKHFFDCLKYLLKENRLIIVPVKFNGTNLAHRKKMLLYDGETYISTEGSINFTLPALLKNSESFQVNAPWVSNVAKAIIEEDKKQFESIINKEHKSYNYIDKQQIEVVVNSVGRDKNINDLLDDSLKLGNDIYGSKVKTIISRKKERFKAKLEEIINTPRFPFSQGPREYQMIAYQNWIKNNYMGIFAMATGTGKTITSLNCILEQYRLENSYKFIVLVPTRALVEQWEKEILNKFNFKNLISIRSKYFYEELKYEDEDENSCILVTYATFKTNKFQKTFNRIKHLSKFTLIADEAHNMGSRGFLNVMNSLNPINRRIGLSATPSRYFDEFGEKEVYEFFNTSVEGSIPNFSYSFSIAQAINAKPKPFLCPYQYRIKFVELEPNELTLYRRYTRQLLNFIDKDGKLKMCIEVENILKQRKDVIKKAKRKRETLIDIIEEIGVDNFKYAFVYVPEGKEIDYSDDDSDWNETTIDDNGLISDYTKSINIHFNYSVPIRHFTGQTKEREQILKQFSDGDYSTLFAMKCLDEGVDVPRTEIAIFCSSTGNPRQYVQRRGRVLRLHDNKDEALIYDMIVIPVLEELDDSTKEYKCEKSLVASEIRRLLEFAKDSKSFDDILLNTELINICDFFNINLEEILN